MQSSNLFRIPELAYTPLPAGAYDAALEGITKCGFSQDAILEQYSFSSANVKSPVKLNALAFAHPIHRNPGEYASFTVYNAINGLHDEAIVPILAESAAPFHIIHRDERFFFWGSTIVDKQPKPIPLLSNISYDQLAQALDEYAPDLEPQRIVDVKLGRDSFTLPMLREMQPMQLSFWAADVTRPLLVDYFAQAVNALRRYAKRQRTEIPDETLTSLAIQLLGAIVLADTGVLDDDIRLGDVSMRQLFERAASRFARYFQPNILFTYEEAAERAYQILRQIRYSGFVPEMLASIYTAAFSKEQRKKLGRYDTPLYLTRRIWENIPVEYLPPQQRHVVDMTCGWGSFLIAGRERIAQLSDTPSSLRSFLHGNDVDPFTSQLAGLGLLLSTSEDSWRVDHSDALEWQWLETSQPGIIVGNPPFGSIQDSSITGTDSWYEEANKYLAYAIDRLAPNGYLAMLMPRSFTSSLASQDCRKQLLERCDVLELEEAASHNQEAPRDAMQMIDTVLKRAYHLDDTTFERLRKVSEWDSKPQITLDSQPNLANAIWTLGGVVKSIQAEEGIITLWMEGFQEMQTVQIVPTMPGWTLRSGAAFRAKIPAIYLDQDRIDPGAIDWGTFRPQPYTYMREEAIYQDSRSSRGSQ